LTGDGGAVSFRRVLVSDGGTRSSGSAKAGELAVAVTESAASTPPA
jgi:hypothetical protein